jgi:ABC-2 type transport system ATP-binding protein
METQRQETGTEAPSGFTSSAGIGIEARDLTRRFGSHVALDHLSLSIPPNQTFGLMGANGAGKTTFIRLVTGYLLPSEGSVTVGGFSPAANPRAVKERLGFVMETSRLYPELRVRGFLRFMGGTRDLSGPVLEAAVERVIERFQLQAPRPFSTTRRWSSWTSPRAASIRFSAATCRRCCAGSRATERCCCAPTTSTRRNS